MNIYKIDIKEVISLIKEAGKILLHYYKNDNLPYKFKSDNSEVSIADIESNNLICSYLEKNYPQIPIISEENDNREISNNVFWSIDPLDGTKSYLRGYGDFTINIGLIADNQPFLGIVYAPLSNELYYTEGDGIAYKLGNGIIKSRNHPKEGLTVVIGSSTRESSSMKKILSEYKVKDIVKASSALKFCLIAEGKADLYPRIGSTMEWDTAAGHAILKAAGGNVLELNGDELLYGKIKQKYLNPGFIAKVINTSC